MRNTSIMLTVAGFAALLLGACSGGGSFQKNKAPVAHAGAPLTVNVGQLVTLDGTGSSDPNDNLVGYQWTQTAGTTMVSLSGATTPQPSFTMPSLPAGSTLTFRLVVSDSEGLTSAPATVVITVSDGTTVPITGTVRYERVPFRTTPNRLDYANTVMLPVRGAVIRVYNGSTLIAESTTSDTGTYSFNVPTNTSISIQVEARLRRNAALPNWNIRVQNGANPLAPYRYNTPQFSSGVGTRDIDIATGISTTGAGGSTSTRPSGPFAILDTIYTAIQTVLTAVPQANMPPLYVNWGQDLGAFYTLDANFQQFIALRDDLSEDTDEFDQAVIAHEFGHYLEANFSRSDSMGGSHGLGDRLDPSVAFSEGIATAFGAMVLNSPLYLDSYVDNGTLQAGSFNIELNPATGAPPGGVMGCWCSESTVWSLGWDIYDSAADANDNVDLGFVPFWQAWTSSAHRNTPALTSIFSFINALKAAQPAQAANIDTLVAAQNIDQVVDEFGTGETHAPYANLLPLYTNITVGGSVTLRTTDDGGTYNRAGNRRYLRFVAPGSGLYTFTLTTNNPNAQADPDFVILRTGEVVVSGESSPDQEPVATEREIFAPSPGTTYVIDIYDCANGCPPQQGVPGDYDLTMAIN